MTDVNALNALHTMHGIWHALDTHAIETIVLFMDFRQWL